MIKTLGLVTRVVFCGFTFLSGLSFLVSMTCSPQQESGPVWRPRWEVLSSQAWTARHESPYRHYLIERQDSSIKPLALPDGYLWGMISVSPWSDAMGKVEGVGACHRTSSRGAEPFCGLARIDLVGGKILEEVPLDILPTGRPCWVPGSPGRIVLAAGDGLLYTHQFARSEPSGRLDDPQADSRVPAPVVWECRPPGDRIPHLVDPCWSSHPRLRNLLIASVITPADPLRRRSTDMTSIWWLRLSPEGKAITDAGVLFDPQRVLPEGASVALRFPTLAAGPEGTTHLVYLNRPATSPEVRVEAIAIELDGASGRPRIREASSPTILGTGAGMAPIVVAADDRSIFYLSPGTSRPIAHGLLPETFEKEDGELARFANRR